MALPNIGLYGIAGSGKDTVADYLVKHYGYAKVSFAAPLKEMALELDPVIDFDEPTLAQLRLSEAVDRFGWDGAKRSFPEVRTFLRNLGRTWRRYDERFWINFAQEEIRSARRAGLPVVVTDVRYENEYYHLWECPNRFDMVEVWRPGVDASVDPESVELIASATPEWTIYNSASISILHMDIDRMLDNLARA